MIEFNTHIFGEGESTGNNGSGTSRPQSASGVIANVAMTPEQNKVDERGALSNPSFRAGEQAEVGQNGIELAPPPSHGTSEPSPTDLIQPAIHLSDKVNTARGAESTINATSHSSRQTEKSFPETSTTPVENESTINGKSRKQKPWRISTGEFHWMTKRCMLGCLALAVAAVVGHHVYYTSLAGGVVGDALEQQKTRFVGNTFPYIVLAALVMSIEIAMTQYLFLRLTYLHVSVRCLDAAYSATSSLLVLFSREMLRKLPDVAVVAAVIGVLAVPTTIITPGTLVVAPKQLPNSVIMPVHVLGIADFSKATYFELSRPVNTLSSADDNSKLLWISYRTILSRLITATAASGEILPLSMPAVNSTYELNFQGPYVACDKANDTVEEMIGAAIPDISATYANTTQLYNAFAAYVPDLSSSESKGKPSERDSDPSRGSNQLWLSFKENGTGWVSDPYPQCPITTYRVCQLYNASYAVTITFQDGSMMVDYKEPVKINTVDYPGEVVDGTDPSDLVGMSYSAYMWAFTDLVVGSMGFYVRENVTNENMTSYFTTIDTKIQNTPLLGSVDLNCFDAFSWFFDNKTWEEWSDQRQMDIAFAQNGKPLDQLIPELSANTTISLMNDILLTMPVNSTVILYDTVQIYSYRTATLLISYAIALFAASVANVLGLIAFHRNKIRVDKNFSSTASATQHLNLLDQTLYEHRGSIPAPTGVMDTMVQFQHFEEGGWGFQKVHCDKENCKFWRCCSASDEKSPVHKV